MKPEATGRNSRKISRDVRDRDARDRDVRDRDRDVRYRDRHVRARDRDDRDRDVRIRDRDVRIRDRDVRIRDPGVRIRDLAGRQHGVVERGQLLAAGLAVWEVDNRVRNGRLERLHRAVYRVPGPVRGPREAEMAAVLACGEGALASHGTAAQLLNLPLPTSPDGRTEVLVVDAYRRPGPSVRVRRVARLDAADRALADGVPVTAPARTLLDLAPRVRPRTLEHAVAWAEREGVAGLRALEDVVARYPLSRGAGPLRALLGRDAPPAFVRSSGEARLLELIDEAGLPRPRTNFLVEGFEVDFVWGAQRLIVELDGRRYHERDPAFDRDRRRDVALTLAGYRVLRLTWPRIRDERVATAGLLVRAFYDGGRALGGGAPER